MSCPFSYKPRLKSHRSTNFKHQRLQSIINLSNHPSRHVIPQRPETEPTVLVPQGSRWRLRTGAAAHPWSVNHVGALFSYFFRNLTLKCMHFGQLQQLTHSVLLCTPCKTGGLNSTPIPRCFAAVTGITMGQKVGVTVKGPKWSKS